MNTAKLAKIMKALSHPKRLEVYLKIAEKNTGEFETTCEGFIPDLIVSLKLGAPTISHHIKELENADLITTERQGKFLTAKINSDTLKEAAQILFGKVNGK